jgi:hypothetical protein
MSTDDTGTDRPDGDIPADDRREAEDLGEGPDEEDRGRADGRDEAGGRDGADGRDEAGGRDAADEASGRDEAADERHSIESLSGGPAPPRPPRRTGIFVDPEDLREHVGHLLRAILGGYEVDGFGNYTFTHEGARVFVTVGGSPIGPTVGVFSVTNLELELTPPLASFLLSTNHTLGFGAFSYDASNRAVWLRHTLLGTTLDGPELQSAVAAVATTAAHLDDRIRDRFGGRTFQEAPGDVQRRVEPPAASPEGTPYPGTTGYL